MVNAIKRSTSLVKKVYAREHHINERVCSTGQIFDRTYRFESCPDYKKLKVMKKDTKDTLKVVGIMIMFTSLLLYSFYVHRNEPHWFETRYVKIVK